MPALRLAQPTDFDTIVAIDDDATRLYAQVGLHLDLPEDHPYVQQERARWRRALNLGRIFLAMEPHPGGEAPVGFAALDLVDGAPYLDQLSIRRAAMKRGFGRRLLARAIAWGDANGDALWLTTYGHVPWNRPFYEKEGFIVVPEPEWGPGIAADIAEQRLALPCPGHRVVMRRRRVGSS
jgi:GNAT superfamily N-acetyltransferase